MDVSRCVQEKVIQTEKERRHGNPVRSRILPRCQNLGDRVIVFLLVVLNGKQLKTV